MTLILTNFHKKIENDFSFKNEIGLLPRCFFLKYFSLNSALLYKLHIASFKNEIALPLDRDRIKQT